MTPGSAIRIFVTCLLLVAACCDGRADSLADAKRRAAVDLIRERKYDEAIGLLKEVVTVDGDRYKDRLTLARAYDAANRGSEAANEYRAVVRLLPTPGTVEEKSARQEAERRLKVLDRQSEKVDAAVLEFLKKLDQLEHEATSAKNASAVERVARLRMNTYRGIGSPDRGGLEVTAQIVWQDTGFRVEQGQLYRVVAYGSWKMGKQPADECDANGTGRSFPEGWAELGRLVGCIDQKYDRSTFMALGTDVTFKAYATGTLFLAPHEHASKTGDNSGSLLVLVARVSR